MKLGEYLDKNGLKYGAFAERIGIKYQDIYRIINFGKPSLKVALDIEKETKGAVKTRDLLEPERVPTKRPKKEKVPDESFEEVHCENKQFEKSPK